NIVYDLNIPLPSLNEQKQITNFIYSKTAKIDSLISKIQSQISKLQEFRESLISSAVTGKIKVAQA
ncbi:MAG: restriction endonuclease subunit S, partial [Candidatus Nitrosopelagicus sp.]|nr:restriction endonuclease subunit S [Candidatus Nitrosopelagicus sp.]